MLGLMNVVCAVLYGTARLFLRSSAARRLRSSRACSLKPSKVSCGDKGCSVELVGQVALPSSFDTAVDDFGCSTRGVGTMTTGSGTTTGIEVAVSI